MLSAWALDACGYGPVGGVYDHTKDYDQPEWTALGSFQAQDWSPLEQAYKERDMRMLWSVIIIAGAKLYPPNVHYAKRASVDWVPFNKQIMTEAVARLQGLPGHARWLATIYSFDDVDTQFG